MFARAAFGVGPDKVFAEHVRRARINGGILTFQEAVAVVREALGPNAAARIIKT